MPRYFDLILHLRNILQIELTIILGEFYRNLPICPLTDI